MIILVLLIFVLTIVGGNVQLFTYEQLQDLNQPPIYVEEMEKIKVYADTWKFVTRIDMNNYENEFKHLQEVVNKTFALCNFLNNGNDYLDTLYKLRSGCTSTVTKLNNIVAEMEDFNWSQLVTSSLLIKQKQYFKNLARLHLGSLSQKNAETYLQQLNQIKQTKKESSQLVGQRTTIIEASAECLSDNEKQLLSEKDYIDTKINDIMVIFNMRTSNLEPKGSRIKNLLQDLLSYTTLLITHFKVKQQSISKTLSIGSLKRQMPHQILLQELKQILLALRPSNQELPFDLHHEWIGAFYEVAVAKSRIINKQVIVSYTIPIVQLIQFTLYHLNPFPRKIKEGAFQLILPDFQYVAINRRENKYITMTEVVLENCYSNDDNILICRLMGSIISTRESGSCAIELLTEAEISSDCNYRILNFTNELWLQLAQKNSWLLVFPKPQEITIDCDGDIYTRFVNGVGILRIKPTCSVETKYVQIIGCEEENNVTYEKVDVAVETKINWSDIAEIFISSKITNYVVPRVIYYKQSETLEKISIAVKDVQALQIKTTFAQKETHSNIDDSYGSVQWSNINE